MSNSCMKKNATSGGWIIFLLGTLWKDYVKNYSRDLVKKVHHSSVSSVTASLNSALLLQMKVKIICINKLSWKLNI